MANAFGFLTSTVPSLRIKVHPSETKALLRRRAVTVCSSGIEDVGKHVSPSPAQSHKSKEILATQKTPIACDIRAACSGFMLGLFSAACYVRGTCVLFGDAAGAVVVQACKAEEDGLLSFDFHSDGEGGRHLGSPIKYSQTNDLSVFHFAARRVPQSTETALKKASLTASGINWFPSVISNLANYGNTSAASIPLELDDAVRSGKVKQGHTIAAAGFKAGLTWTSAVIRWG
ncbi:hypothetical protein V6N13_074407 [Hibiscus sabdariffa]